MRASPSPSSRGLVCSTPLPRALLPIFTFVWLAGSVSARVAEGGEAFPEWVATAPGAPPLAIGGAVDRAVAPDGTLFVVSDDGGLSDPDIRTSASSRRGELLWSHVFASPVGKADHAFTLALGPSGVHVLGSTPEPSGHGDILWPAYDRATGSLVRKVTYSRSAGVSDAPVAAVAEAQGRLFVAGMTIGDGFDVILLAHGPTDASGAFGFALFVPPQAAGVQVWFQSAELGQLSSPVARTVE